MFTSPWNKPYRGMQVNKAHPLARGLIGCWVMNEATGDIVFDLSGGGNHGANNGADWVADGLDFDGASDLVIVDDTPQLFQTNEFTIYIRYKSNANNDGLNSDGIISSGGVGAAGTWSIFQTTGESIGGHFETDTPSAVNIDSGVTATVGTWYDIVYSNDGTNTRIYIDGVEKASGASGTPLTGVWDLYFAGWNGDRERDCTISTSIIYGRALTSDEVKWLHREPYAMFQQPISPASLYYEAAAAATIPVFMNHYKQMMRA